MRSRTLIDRFLARRPAKAGIEILRAFESSLRRLQITFEVATPYAEFRLRNGSDEAVTTADQDGATMVFRSTQPSRSAVLEELAHAFQARADSFGEFDIRIMICEREIEAKSCLVENQARLDIPAEEHHQTLVQLAAEQARRGHLRKQFI